MEHEKTYKLYMHISPSGKRYVGITSYKNPNTRWQSGRGYPKNPHLSAAIEKYGWENFKHIILADGLTKEDAERAEIKCIKHWDLRNPEKGYNISRGGDAPTKGWHHSEESKKKISLGNRGKIRTPEMRARNSSIVKNLPYRPYTDKSYESHRHVWRDKKRAVWCEELGSAFNSGTEAARFLGASRSGISQCCNHKANRVTEKGYHFRWATEEEAIECNRAKNLMNYLPNLPSVS